jgi:hypothetical protein
MTASEIVTDGAKILGSVIIPEGFVFHPSASGKATSYPCFSDDPAEQSCALGDDPLCFGQRFLRGSVDGFVELQSWLAENPRPTP